MNLSGYYIQFDRPSHLAELYCDGGFIERVPVADVFDLIMEYVPDGRIELSHVDNNYAYYLIKED